MIAQCEGYNAALGPPVLNVQICSGGTYAFVEFRDELMAVTALQLDKIELAGRALNVGRPAGYAPAPGMPMPNPLELPPGDGRHPGEDDLSVGLIGVTPGKNRPDRYLL